MKQDKVVGIPSFRVLLIEDNPGDIRLIRELLGGYQRTSFPLTLAGRLAAGLQQLASGQFDVTLLDLSLPDSTGLETFIRIKKQAPDLPVVILTGLDDEDLATTSVRQGAQDYLVKGKVDSELLGRTIRYAIERKRAEEVLRESERKLKEAQALGQVGNWEYDIDRQEITWSDEAYELYERDPVLGPPTVEEEAAYYLPEQAQALREYARRAVEEGKRFEYDLEAVLPSGRHVCYSARMQPVKDAQGRVTKLFGTVQDITERRRTEEEIRRLNEELEQRVRDRTTQLEAANKELEAFSYSVSHDLRAPLRAIDGFSRILVEEHGSQLAGEARRYLGLVRENTLQMGHLVDDLLAFSRLSRQPLVRRAVDTGEIVQEALAGLRSEYVGRDVQLSVAELPSCQADPALLKQVWVNLLSNALKFTRMREKAVVEIGCRKDAGRDVFYVKDNGVGFDMQYAGKLFGVFQRLHRSEEYEGTGVGLAIAQRIVRRHGGRLWAEAEEDKGACFYFCLEGADAHD